jgi:hypothetical protein
MAITYGPHMIFPDSYDRDEPDHTPYAEDDSDPMEEAGVFPFDLDGTQVIDPRDEQDDEDWVLNLRGGW